MSKNRQILYISFLICVFSLTFCANDYRTDYEKAQGIELTPEQIAVREYNERERLRAWNDYMRREEERRRLERLARCQSASYLDCWR